MLVLNVTAFATENNPTGITLGARHMHEFAVTDRLALACRDVAGIEGGAGQGKAKEDGGMSKQHWVRGAWAVAAIMATGVAWAALPQQTSNDPATGEAPGTTQRSADWNQNRGRAMNGRVDVDHFSTKVIRQANRDEIATAQLAEKRASNPDVKKFAMQLVEDHTRFMNRLQQFEGGQHKAMPGARTRGLNQGASNFQPCAGNDSVSGHVRYGQRPQCDGTVPAKSAALV